MGRGRTRQRIKGQFAVVRHDMVKSKAYRALSPVARAIWIELLVRYNGHNNGELPLSCREAGKLVGVGKATAQRGLQELVDTGFIRVAQDSTFNMKQRFSRRYRLTHADVDGRPGSITDDWKSWSPS